MLIRFDKYHGAGNDFIMIDQRKKDISQFSEKIVSQLCHRQFGIGADGLILLTDSNNADFRMIYFNSDGREGTMCGNGGRCITAFARNLGIIQKDTVFEGIDGLHNAEVLDNENYKLKMIDVPEVYTMKDGHYLNTGSDHFVTQKTDIQNIDINKLGRELRYEDRFGETGTNVNFIEIVSNNELNIRTYERGVENETLACGTGSVAAAISAFLSQKTDKTSYHIHAPGGNLVVDFEYNVNEGFKNIWLSGPAKNVFSGTIKI